MSTLSQVKAKLSWSGALALVPTIGQSSLMIPLLVQVIIKIPINPKNFMSIKNTNT